MLFSFAIIAPMSFINSITKLTKVSILANFIIILTVIYGVSINIENMFNNN